MRLHRLILSCVVALPWLLACSEEDPAPLFFKIDYQVRCLDCEPRSMDDPSRKIRDLDGERGFEVKCRATRQGGDRIATFSAIHTDSDPSDNYGITIDQVNLDAGDPGASCRVTVTEGNNTYEGVCSAGDPDPPTAPCKVELEVDGEVIQGSVYCDDIPNRSTTTITRYIVAPGEDAPADFEIQGCSGL